MFEQTPAIYIILSFDFWIQSSHTISTYMPLVFLVEIDHYVLCVIVLFDFPDCNNSWSTRHPGSIPVTKVFSINKQLFLNHKLCGITRYYIWIIFLIRGLCWNFRKGIKSTCKNIARIVIITLIKCLNGHTCPKLFFEGVFEKRLWFLVGVLNTLITCLWGPKYVRLLWMCIFQHH